MKNLTSKTHLFLVGIFSILTTVIFIACGSDDTSNDAQTTNNEVLMPPPPRGGNTGEPFEDDGVTLDSNLHSAFAEFNPDNTNIYLEDENVVIETNGLPDHKTFYWGEGHELYQERTVATGATPSLIPNYDASTTLRVLSNPQIASSTTATNLGSIGIAVSGASIYNDQEGNGALDQAAGSLDYTGGHIGPTEYHYHLEPKAWSDDDDKLIGILNDGFFIYGRKCNSTGTYPTDLDASGGHTHITQHSTGAEYHYHIINELYSNTGRYIVFVGPFKGEISAN